MIDMTGLTEMKDIIKLKPIGLVHNEYADPGQAKVSVSHAAIEIYPEYTDALLRLQEHSHIWVLGWFHQAGRDKLRVIPRINQELPEYGVFAIRAFNRPNPIGLSVVKLESVEGNILNVSDLDFIDQTPVLDIKPYYDQDIVFSPDCPYIRPMNPTMLGTMMMKKALNHHREECEYLTVAVRMALLAEKEFGDLAAKDLKVCVTGSGCLGDTLQGLTQARLANPRRFTFIEDEGQAKSVWEKDGKVLTITLEGDDLNYLLFR